MSIIPGLTTCIMHAARQNQKKAQEEKKKREEENGVKVKYKDYDSIFDKNPLVKKYDPEEEVRSERIERIFVTVGVAITIFFVICACFAIKAICSLG